jgi:hypothetical protein
MANLQSSKAGYLFLKRRGDGAAKSGLKVSIRLQCGSGTAQLPYVFGLSLSRNGRSGGLSCRRAPRWATFVWSTTKAKNTL